KKTNDDINNESYSLHVVTYLPSKNQRPPLNKACNKNYSLHNKDEPANSLSLRVKKIFVAVNK
ncbi:hypothetical protein OFO87_31040, partial [Escherichia coli]|nr:hypothetical protein [Escherichia coli]